VSIRKAAQDLLETLNFVHTVIASPEQNERFCRAIADLRAALAEEDVEAQKIVAFIKSQEPLPPEFAKVLNDNFWELLAAHEQAEGGE
jgi:hypothetical protein